MTLYGEKRKGIEDVDAVSLADKDDNADADPCTTSTNIESVTSNKTESVKESGGHLETHVIVLIVSMPVVSIICVAVVVFIVKRVYGKHSRPSETACPEEVGLTTSNDNGAYFSSNRAVAKST